MNIASISNVFDILVVAVLIYGVIVLLKKTHSFFVVLGIAIISLVYVLAVVLELSLTATIFQSFFGVFLIALVVIFQGELRRFFELVAFWGSASWRIKNRAKTGLRHYIESIVHVTERLMREKVGMLIVLTGKESLMRHLQGGFELEGKISEPLLLSVFDASSPGHDGAVIIENGVITKFGVHLPLSKDFQQIKNYGTRHSAALGIAEVSDAMSIIVSEERGIASVAYDSKLYAIENMPQLTDEIEKFLKRKSQTIESYNFWEGWFTRDINNKMLALLIAVLAWLLFVWSSR